MVKNVFMRDEKILESWSVLIENAQGKSEEVFKQTSNFIQESKVPGVKFEIVKVRTGESKGLFKGLIERDFLMVVNDRSKDYRMYVGSRDYGNNLNVTWYLTCEPRILKMLVSSFVFKDPQGWSFSLGLFRHEELIAYTTVVHHCLLKAVEQIMHNAGQDPSKIDRKSRGFLGIS